MALSLKLCNSPNLATIDGASWFAKILIFSVCSPSNSTFKTQIGSSSSLKVGEALELDLEGLLSIYDGDYYILAFEGGLKGALIGSLIGYFG